MASEGYVNNPAGRFIISFDAVINSELYKKLYIFQKARGFCSSHASVHYRVFRCEPQCEFFFLPAAFDLPVHEAVGRWGGRLNRVAVELPMLALQRQHLRGNGCEAFYTQPHIF